MGVEADLQDTVDQYRLSFVDSEVNQAELAGVFTVYRESDS